MILKIRVIPNSKKNEVVGIINSVVKIKICAPATEGKANEELREFLADFFDVKRSGIFLKKGEHCREKIVEIDGKSEEEINKILNTI